MGVAGTVLANEIHRTTNVDTGALQASTDARELPTKNGYRIGWFVKYLTGPVVPHLPQAKGQEYGAPTWPGGARTIRTAVRKTKPRMNQILHNRFHLWIRSVSRLRG